MDKKKWPFGFFVYSNVDGEAEAEADAVEVVEEAAPAEAVEVVWAQTPAAVIAEEETEVVEDDLAEDEFVEDAIDELFDAEEADDEFDEETGLPDLEEELEIALEAAHQEEVKKQRLITGISAGVALLGAIGLATGFALHNHFKKK